MSSIFSSTPENSTISMLVENGNEKTVGTTSDRMNSSLCSQTSTGVIYECQEQAIKASFGHQEVCVEGLEYHIVLIILKDEETCKCHFPETKMQ